MRRGPERAIGVLAVAAGAAAAAGTAVGAAPHILQLVDDFHRADLGRSRERARREGGLDGVEPVAVGLDAPRHVADDVHDVRVVLDLL